MSTPEQTGQIARSQTHRDHAHDRKHARQRTRVDREQNQSVDDVLAVLEARAGAVEQVDERAGDRDVADGGEDVDRAREVDDLGEVCVRLEREPAVTTFTSRLLYRESRTTYACAVYTIDTTNSPRTSSIRNATM